MSEVANRKNVLFVLPSLAGGGAERVIVTLLQYLDRERFRLSLAVVNMQSPAYLADVPADVEVIDLGCRRVRHAAWRLISLIRGRRPDVVFSTLGHLNLMIAFLIPWLPKTSRFIAREASVASKSMYLHSRPWLIAWLYKRLYKRFDRVVCQSESMRDDLIREYGLPAAKAVVIGNPIAIERVRIQSGEGAVPAEMKPGCFNVVAAGRLSHEKGMDLLLHAVSLCKDIPINAVILGEGPLRGNLERQIAESGLSDRVTLAGFKANPYVYFAHADLFVLSSRVEGFPNVVLEALACGISVAATPCADVLDDILVESGGGWLAPGISGPELAETLRAAYAAPRRVPDIRRLEARFGAREVAEEYERVLVGTSRDSRPAGRIV